MFPTIYILYFIQKYDGFIAKKFSISLYNKMKLFFFYIRNTLILKIDKQYFFPGMTLCYQVLNMLIEHIRLTGTANPHQYIIGVFIKRDTPILESYFTNKLLLPKYDLLNDVFIHFLPFYAIWMQI